jgi:hypothetical protein
MAVVDVRGVRVGVPDGGVVVRVAVRLFTTSKSSLLLGAGPNAVFSVSDALDAPLAARQVVHARQAEARRFATTSPFRFGSKRSLVQIQSARLSDPADNFCQRGLFAARAGTSDGSPAHVLRFVR